MIRRTLARLTVSSLVALTLVGCQDMESPTAPSAKIPTARFSLNPNEQLDQQNLVPNTGFSTSNNSYGQSFTAGVTGQLTTLSLLVTCASAGMLDGVIEVYKGQYDLYNTDYGRPVFSPPPIASQPVAATIWPTDCSYPLKEIWIDIAFTTPASIVAGQAYTFRLRSPSEQPSIWHPGNDRSSYAGGTAFSYPDYEIVFKTFVTPPTAQLDQQNLVPNTGFSTSNNSYGQSFTAGITGQLTRLSLLVTCASAGMLDGVIEVYKGQYDLYNTDYGRPVFSPPPIASQPVAASIWPTDCSYPLKEIWIDVAFTTPASIVAGQAYTFRLRSPSEQPSIWHPGNDRSSYAGGTAFSYPDFEIVFKTFVLAGAEPTDATPPVVTPVVTGTLGSNSWYTSNVNVSWTVVDAESAISTSTGCGSTVVNADNAGVTFTCSATSGGGTASQSVTVKRDATGPTLSPSVTPNPVVLNASGSASPNASNARSGLAFSSCGTVITTSVGVKTVSCVAYDNAGNQSNQTASYTVIWPFTGFLGGINAAPTMNSEKAGTTIQLKFTLGGNRGLAIFAAGSPTSQQVNCSKPADIGAAVAVGGTGPTYDAKNGQYAYAWKTDKAWAGTCRRVSVKLVDGSDHTAVFQFTK